MLGQVIRLCRLIDPPSEEEYCVPTSQLTAKEMEKRRPVTAEAFREVYQTVNITYNAGVWLKRLCLMRGRMDLFSIVADAPGYVAQKEQPKKKCVVIDESKNVVSTYIPPPWETFEKRVMARRNIMEDEYEENAIVLENARRLMVVRLQ